MDPSAVKVVIVVIAILFGTVNRFRHPIVVGAKKTGTAIERVLPLGKHQKTVTADILNVTVTPPLQTGVAPYAAQIVGQATSSLGSVINSWSWNFGESALGLPYQGCIGTPATATKCPMSINHIYTKPGVYTVYFLATDVLNSVKQVTTTVTVSALPPDVLTASLSINSGDNSPIATPVMLLLAANSSQGTIASISLDCGNGQPPQVQNLFYAAPSGVTLTIAGMSTFSGALAGTCLYPNSGLMTPKVTVTDSLNKTVTATVPVNVLPVTANGIVYTGPIPCNVFTPYGYALPAWITALNFLYPTDVIYGGNIWLHTTQVDPSRQLVSTKAGTNYCVWLAAGGGTPPYTFSGQNLPPGMTVSPDGLLSGVATTPGLYQNIIFTVVDSVGATVTLAPRYISICLGTEYCNGSGQ